MYVFVCVENGVKKSVSALLSLPSVKVSLFHFDKETLSLSADAYKIFYYLLFGIKEDCFLAYRLHSHELTQYIYI